MDPLIMPRYSCKFVPVPVAEVPEASEITWDDIVRWEAHLRDRQKREFIGQRIWPGLFKLEPSAGGMFPVTSTDRMSIREIRAVDVPLKGTPFKVSSWNHDPEKTIEIGMIYDSQEKKLTGPWPTASWSYLPGDEPPPVAEPGPYCCSHYRH